ncbi:hypothetical protein B0H13DRAFT_1876987 [Mycena leptocephala]|nr:hypothetical protein B0H13DRAFT_1876987 [Mycena leptocephala]
MPPLLTFTGSVRIPLLVIQKCGCNEAIKDQVLQDLSLHLLLLNPHNAFGVELPIDARRSTYANLNFVSIKPILAKESRNFNSFSGPRTAMEVLGQLKFLRVLFSFSAGPIRVFSKLPICACRPDSGAPYIFGDWTQPGYAIHIAQMNPTHLILAAVRDIKKQNAT